MRENDYGFDIKNTSESKVKYWIYGVGIVLLGLSAVSEYNDQWYWAGLALILWVVFFPRVWGLGQGIANRYRTGRW